MTPLSATVTLSHKFIIMQLWVVLIIGLVLFSFNKNFRFYTNFSFHTNFKFHTNFRFAVTPALTKTSCSFHKNSKCLCQGQGVCVFRLFRSLEAFCDIVYKFEKLIFMDFSGLNYIYQSCLFPLFDR